MYFSADTSSARRIPGLNAPATLGQEGRWSWNILTLVIRAVNRPLMYYQWRADVYLNGQQVPGASISLPQLSFFQSVFASNSLGGRTDDLLDDWALHGDLQYLAIHRYALEGVELNDLHVQLRRRIGLADPLPLSPPPAPPPHGVDAADRQDVDRLIFPSEAGT